MSSSTPPDPIHGTPMSPGMRRLLWATLFVLSVGSMGSVAWMWRQQRAAMEARIPKIDRSEQRRNEFDPAAPLPDPTFANTGGSVAAPSRGATG